MQASSEALLRAARCQTYTNTLNLDRMQHKVEAYLDASGRQGSSARNKVFMNGPGGTGRSEVAVASVPSAETQPGSKQGRGPNQPLLNLVQKGLRAVSSLLGEGEGSVGSRLQCALLSVVLPVDALAGMIVKGS